MDVESGCGEWMWIVDSGAVPDLTLLADSLQGANWPGSEKARYPVIYHTLHV